MKYVVVLCTGEVRIEEGDNISDAAEELDWKYPGTVVSITLLPEDEL